MKYVAERDEFFTQFDVVIDLSIVDHPVPVAVVHRLVARRREVQNGKAAVPKDHGAPVESAHVHRAGGSA